jgi:hypothetical protein
VQAFPEKGIQFGKICCSEQQFILIDSLILDKLNFHWLILYNVN